MDLTGGSPALQESTAKMGFPEIVVKGHELDLSQLAFGELRHYEKSKAPYVPVTYCNKALIVQTPEMLMPFGVGMFIPEGKSEGEKNLDLSFRGGNEQVQAFEDRMAQLDEMVLSTSIACSESWFGKKKKRDVLEENHNRIVKVPRKEEYGRSMKVKWPGNGAEPTFWDANRKPVEEDYVTNNSKGFVLMELRPLYIVQNKAFGLKWVVRQVMVKERAEQLSGCGFSVEGPEDHPGLPPVGPGPEIMDEDEPAAQDLPEMV